MRVPVERPTSAPCASTIVCRNLTRSVFRFFRYRSSGVGAVDGAWAPACVCAAAEAEACGAFTAPASAATKHNPAAIAAALDAVFIIFLSFNARPVAGLIFSRRGRQHLARAVRLQGSDEAGDLHRFEQPGGAVVADLEPSLYI